jgi:TFIIF-interacting CTD phosphatase-like protein
MKNFTYNDFEKHYVIFERPGLQKFLDTIFQNYNVSVWTAASKDYALFVIKKFILTKPGRHLDFVFYSHHCDMSKNMKRGLKGLSMLWDVFGLKHYSAANTVIIDDNPDVLKGQEANVIAIKPFHFSDRASYRDNSLEMVEQELERRSRLYVSTANREPKRN